MVGDGGVWLVAVLWRWQARAPSLHRSHLTLHHNPPPTSHAPPAPRPPPPPPAAATARPAHLK